MSTRPEKSWSLWCDFPGCGRQFEAGDYSIFGDGYDPDEIVTDHDGRVGLGGKHYCYDHPAIWASDLADGDPAPPVSHLLIHDGDTGNPDDDGKASLVILPATDGTPC